ncbi:MAG: RHS repeat protein, partial [Planctomycetaceae bacterium]|nr:RHS repeat protein [Planctomycetaceae bacterium]
MPATVTSGQPVTISYTTTNHGQPIAAGTWKDRLYISASPVFDARLAFLVVEVERTCDLETGEQCANTVTAAVPGVNPGNYFWHLLTDVSQQVPDVNRTNNLTTSTASTLVDSDPMFVGETIVGTIAAGQNFYFRLELTEAQATQLTATTSAANAIRVFISEDEMPSNWNFDYEAAATSSTTRTHNFSDTQARTYFVHLRALPAAAAGIDYALSWQSLPLSITNISSGRGSNLGTASVLLSGTAFTRNTTAQLIDSQGAVVREGDVFFVDSETIQVTVDLTDVPAGFYGWQVLDAGSAAQCGGDCYEVGSFAVGALSVSINAADSRVGIPAPVTVTWTNTGNTDVASPFFILRGENAIVGFEDCTDASCMNTSLVFFGGSSTGRVDVVRPGESVIARFTYLTSNADPFTLTCSISDESTPLPDRFLESILTGSFTREQQAKLIEVLQENGVGDTIGSFQNALRTIAANLNRIGIRGLNDIGSLTSALLNQTSQFGKLTTLATGTRTPGATADFFITEIVNNSIVEGDFGRIVIRGSGFGPDTEILLVNGLLGEFVPFEVLDANTILIDASDLSPGTYELNIGRTGLNDASDIIEIADAVIVKESNVSSRSSVAFGATATGNIDGFRINQIQSGVAPGVFIVRGEGMDAVSSVKLLSPDGTTISLPYEASGFGELLVMISTPQLPGTYGLSVEGNVVRFGIPEELRALVDIPAAFEGNEIRFGIPEEYRSLEELDQLINTIPLNTAKNRPMEIFSLEQLNELVANVTVSQVVNNRLLAEAGGKVFFRGTGFSTDMSIFDVAQNPIGTLEFISTEEVILHVDPALKSGSYTPTLFSGSGADAVPLISILNGLVVSPSAIDAPILRVSSPASFGRGTRDITQFRLTNAGDRFIATIGGSDITLVKDSAGRFVSLSAELIPVRETETEITVVSGDEETTFDKTTGEFKRQRNRNTGRTLAPVFFDATLGLIAGTVDDHGNPATQFQRDENGNVISRTDDDGETSFEYDSQNRVERVTTPDGVATTFTRSPEQQFADLVTRVSNSLDQSFELLYDELNQLRQILNVNTGERFTLERNEAGFLSNVLDGSGAPTLGSPPADAANIASSIAKNAANEIAS